MSSKGCGGSRSGSGRKPIGEHNKSIRATFQINSGAWKYFCSLAPDPVVRHKLIEGWVSVYSIAGGESDRLLAQSPLAAELLAYLEATDAPEHLRDRLESLIVQRASDEDRLATGVIKTKDGAYII